VFKPFFIITAAVLLSACKPVVKSSQVIAPNMPVPKCIASQSHCEISNEAASYSVKFSQLEISDNIITEQPFVIELTPLANKIKRANISKVSGYLEGKDMFMGKVPVFFEQDTTGNRYLAQTLLANCSEDQMIWRLWIKV